MEAVRLASILVMRALEALKVLAPCIRLVVGNLAAGHKAPVLDALREQVRRMAGVGSLAVVAEDSPVAVAEGSQVVGHMALVEDNLQVELHIVADLEVVVDRKVPVEQHHNPEVGPGRMEVAGAALGADRKGLVGEDKANDLVVVDRAIAEVGKANGLAVGTAAPGLVDSNQTWW